MKSMEQAFQVFLSLEQKLNRGVSAKELSQAAGIDRTNASRYLNMLYQENRVEKLEGRPVLYRTAKGVVLDSIAEEADYSFDKLAAIQTSLQIPIQQAKAAMLYPPKGLHTLLLGETGVGKSMFAELMYQFAKESHVMKGDAPFIRFNCADYAENAQLLVSQIFGVKKGAYTGADKDRDGLIKRADGGVLFLDEVHRLSPQGQEMLFTFIDKGSFRPLGETDKLITSDVRIIAATTEKPESYLLNTFTRRIPMIIDLPPLREKDLAERYYLIELFIRQESKRIGKSIYADKNAIISFLLYHCPNNIGQLKSDIQLSCAKAFLNFKAKKENYILITSSDLPQHVCKGLMEIKQHRDRVDFLIKSKSPTVKFNFDHELGYENLNEAHVNEDFYDVIEQKLETLKNKGLRDEEISYAIHLDIESHFNKYIGNIPQTFHKRDLSKLVSDEIIDVAAAVLKLAEQRLQRSFEEKIYIALAMHLHGFLERSKRGTKIYHPKLNSIRVEHPEEFMAAMEAAKLVDSAFGINIPLDEIGYMAMFLSPKQVDAQMAEKNLVAVLVIMHGASTASSMAQVANAMIGEEHAAALDMPLDMSPQLMYEHAKEKLQQLDQGRGVLLMVDMGSLAGFGSMLQKETNIVVKTIDMCSTPLVIDACRKAVLGRDIYFIYDSIKGSEKQTRPEMTPKPDMDLKNILITACFTGEGASERLKHLLEKELQDETLEIIPLNILNKKEFVAKVERFRERYKILAIVSTLDIHIEGIPSISASELLAGDGMQQLKELVHTEQNYQKIGKSLINHIGVDSEKLVKELRQMIASIEQELKLNIQEEVKIGILLHMSFLVDKLRGGGKETYFDGLEDFKQQYPKELKVIRGYMRELEAEYQISIGAHEEAYLCRMLTANTEEPAMV